MPQCQAKKTNGEQCKGTAKVGNQYCSYHQQRYAKNIQHGRKSLPELLGIPNNEHMTFEEFYASEKPYELTQEIAAARTLLAEARKSMEANRPDIRQALLRDIKVLGIQDLVDAGMPEEDATQILKVLEGRVSDAITTYYGAALPLHVEQIKELRSILETTSKICERAKKIADGITLNVNFKNVGLYLVKFTRDVIFRFVPEPDRRASIVEYLRGMNLTGMKPTNVLPGEVVEEAELVM